LRTVLIILVLFSISLVPENVGFNFAFELRALVFAVLICGLIFHFGFSVWRKDVELKKTKFKFGSIDLAYISCVLLTIFSFVTKAQSINAFHFVFVAVGMFVVYSVIRIANLDEILLQSKIIYSVVGIGFIVAVIGFVQFSMGKTLVSTFGRTSYLGCFLAMNVPLAFGLVLQLRITSYKLRLGKFNIGFWLALLVFVVILGVTVLTKSRSAMIALALVLPLMVLATKSLRLKIKKRTIESQKIESRKFAFNKTYSIKIISCLGVLVAVFLIVFLGSKYLYKIKPMSASGRTLIWKVSADMFKKNPINGVGFGNFANSYNFYQANYFASNKGTVVNKMTAGQIRHAYNWYLETAAEIGAFGLIVFGIFWWLILMEVYKAFKPQLVPRPKALADKGHKNTEINYLNLGMGGAVLCFMIMSMFQFPRKIIPTYLIFNFALAWIVTANEKIATKSPRLEEEINKKV